MFNEYMSVFASMDATELSEIELLNYFIYYLVVNENSKNIFVINDPISEYNKGHLKVDKNLVVEFSKKSGQWQKLIEIQN
jgi:hypothetical protein